jgi:hypothetical protein
MTEYLQVTVTSPDFTAGLVMYDNHCIAASERLQWALGKHAVELSHTFLDRAWQIKVEKYRERGEDASAAWSDPGPHLGQPPARRILALV